MPDLGLRLTTMNPEERAALVERAARAITDHQCIVLPTDTLYGLVTKADQQGADLLDTITGHPEVASGPRMTLHLADLDQIIEHLVLEAATVRRLVSRLLPGPVRLVLEQPEPTINALCAALGIPRGVIDDGSHIAIRVPDHPLFRQVLRQAGVACVARRLGSAIWAHDDNPGTDLSPISNNPPTDLDTYPAIIIDDGPTLNQSHSTTVRLSIEGKIEVSPGGAITEKQVLSHLERTILFVCTGNTCRSPMAQAIAKQLLSEQEPKGITTHAASAGVAAGDGMPATPEAIDALESIGIKASPHQSQQLTLPMIDQAEIIYTMTPSHAQAIMTMAPNSVHKVFVLDEQESVPDPIGQSAEVYKHTAQRLVELITKRLSEIHI